MSPVHNFHPKYRPDIDGLRAIAVLAVVIYHAEQFIWPDSNKTSSGCFERYDFKKKGFCISTNSGPVNTILIGDSHANDIFFGLSSIHEKENKNILHVGRGGCLPFFGVIRRDLNGKVSPCKHPPEIHLNYAINNPDISTIILSSRGAQSVTGRGFGSVASEANKRLTLSLPDRPDLKNNADVFKFSMRDTISRLVSSGKQIVFVIDVPEIGFGPKSCIDARPVRFTPYEARRPCAIPRVDVDKRNHEYWRVVHDVLKDFPSVKVFDPIPHLCDKNHCRAMKDEQILYRNNNHLTENGSRYMAEQLAEEMQLP